LVVLFVLVADSLPALPRASRGQLKDTNSGPISVTFCFDNPSAGATDIVGPFRPLRSCNVRNPKPAVCLKALTLLEAFTTAGVRASL
jgi:hypothetical protein